MTEKKVGKWTIETARACIERNGGKVGDKTIRVGTVGLKVLGAIDYLVNHCGYKRTWEG